MALFRAFFDHLGSKIFKLLCQNIHGIITRPFSDPDKGVKIERKFFSIGIKYFIALLQRLFTRIGVK